MSINFRPPLTTNTCAATVLLILTAGCGREAGPAPPRVESMPATAIPPQPVVDENLSRAKRAIGDRDFELAQVCLDRVLAQSPKDVEALECLGHVHLETKRFASAVRVGTELVFLDPANSSGYEIRAVGQVGLEEYLKAIEDIERAIRISKTPAVPLAMLSTFLHQVRKDADAVEIATRAVEADAAFMGARTARILANYAMARRVLIDDSTPLNEAEKRAMAQNHTIIEDCDVLLELPNLSTHERGIAYEYKVKALLALYRRDEAREVGNECRAKIGGTVSAECDKVLREYGAFKNN